jgi:predicted PurR-regulated permease PerM
MFLLPSILNLIVSTIVFYIVANYIHSHLHDRGIPKGRKRTLWVLGLASLISWGAGWTADWTQEKLEGRHIPAQSSVEASQLMKAIDEAQK